MQLREMYLNVFEKLVCWTRRLK